MAAEKSNSTSFPVNPGAAMDLIAANLITLFSTLASCFLASLLPSLIHIHADPNSRKKKILSALNRYSNCLSGGVFAGAFFTQFYPHVTSDFSDLLPATSIWIHPLQLGPSLVFSGFLMTALLEWLVDIILKRLRQAKSMTEGRPRSMQDLSRSTSQKPLVLDDASDDDEESSVDTDLLSPPVLKASGRDVKVPKISSRSSSAASKHIHNHAHSNDHSHHHHHHHHHDLDFDEYQGTTRFIVLVASLGTHSVFEGLALGLITDVQLLLNMFISVVVHEVLMALALGISLARQKMNIRTRLLFCFVFSIIIPVGQGVGLLVQQAPTSTATHGAVTVLGAVAAGTFLHVMFCEILPQEMSGSHFGVIEALWIVTGYALIPLSSLATGAKGHH